MTKKKFTPEQAKEYAKKKDQQTRDIIDSFGTLTLPKLEEALENGVSFDWQKGWNPSGISAHKNVDGEMYKGGNQLALMIEASLKGYTSPYWLTYNACKKLGGNIKKGEKAYHGVVYGVPVVIEKEVTDKKGNKKKEQRSWTSYRSVKGGVFNACQCEGLPESYYPKPEQSNPDQKVPEIDAFFDSLGANIIDSTNGAWYRPSTDAVGMPVYSTFKSSTEWYSTLGHELIHWTKPKHRLNRGGGEFTAFGSTNYAFEELVAELGSMMLMQQFGISAKPTQNNVAYLANWIKALKEKPSILHKACTEASKAIVYLNDLNEKNTKGDTKEEIQEVA